MAFTPLAAKGEPFSLVQHAVLRLSGPDAVAFAHAQFANDVAALPDRQWQWNSLLTPKGRVLAVFALLRLAGDDLLLVLPAFDDAEATALAADLARFVFRKKVEVTRADGMHVLAVAQVAALGTSITDTVDGAPEVALDASGRGWRLATAPAREDDADADAQQAWLETDLRLGLPHLAAAQRAQWTPQQLSLDRLQAYSVKKGCYPGQEIVARTHFLGKAKRGLALIESDRLLPAGATVVHHQADFGVIASSAGRVALAVVPLEQVLDNLLVDGNPVHVHLLQDGITR